MCGLYASIGLTPDERRLDMVAHRGPDGRGWRVLESPCGSVALGHRRLAIIDVSSASSQPMSEPSGRFHIIFNGEVYNYIELRDEMREKGESFVTSSDTEVLLRAYMLWGHEALDRIRGMFAVIIWDARSKQLFAARDRFGIKPLYFFQTARTIAFASEIKQLLGLPGESGRMNVPRVHDFLAAGMSDHTAETMFADVRQVRGGEYIEVDCSKDGALGTTLRRWYPVRNEIVRYNERDAAERFRSLLDDSVRVHLRSDVPIGSCLSGGLDSSSIVCLMANQLGSTTGGRRVSTVSACYSEKTVDERPFMELVANWTHASPHYVFPKAEDVFAEASAITWHQDEPFGSTSIFAQWCVFKKAQQAGLKVMLDGQGADEQLAGYHGAFDYYVRDLWRSGKYGMFARTLWERSSYHGLSLQAQLLRHFGGRLPTYIAQWLGGNKAAPAARNWLDSALLRENGSKVSALAQASAILSLPQVDDIHSLCLTLTQASNMQLLLHWEDRNSMAHSVEARVPFIDHPLVEFNLGLGDQHKIVGGDTKRVLRRAMSGILPNEVRNRRDKLGFATPEEIWFKGPLRGLVTEGVEATLMRYPGLLDAEATRDHVDLMLGGRIPFDFSIWRIVNIGIWGRQFGVNL